MKAFLYKEWKLTLSSSFLLFTALAALVLVPNYPAIVGVGFVFQGIYLYFTLARGNRDTEFSLILPISRRSIVKGKMTVVALLELTQLAAAAVFALVADFVLWKTGNPVFIDPNFAFFGIALLGFAVFHLVFFPWVFGRYAKPGFPLVVGLLAFCGVYALFEILVHAIPALGTALDSLAVSAIHWRLILFAAGGAAYALSLPLSFRMSAEKFERASL